MSGKSHIFPNLLNIEKHLFEIALKGKLNCNKYVSPQWIWICKRLHFKVNVVKKTKNNAI